MYAILSPEPLAGRWVCGRWTGILGSDSEAIIINLLALFAETGQYLRSTLLTERAAEAGSEKS